MNQLLPEIRNIFETFNGEKRYIKEPPKNEEWIEFLTLLKEGEKRVEGLKDKIFKDNPPFLREPLRDALTIKKNNDRVFSSAIALIACGIEPWEFIDVLFTLELMDFSIIIVDDMLDRVKRRANRATFHIRWGEQTTLTVSEILKATATRILLESNIDNEKKVKILREIYKTHKEVYEGQMLDVHMEEKDISDISIDEYLKMIELTTGHQYKEFFKIGVYLSERDELSEVLGKIGLKLGTLGQIRDDLIDYIPDENLTWKMPLSDFRNNKKRLPLIIGWRNATPGEREKLSLLQRKEFLDDEEYMELCSILFKPENIEEIRRLIKKIKDEGIEIVESENFTKRGKSLFTTYFKLGADEI